MQIAEVTEVTADGGWDPRGGSRRRDEEGGRKEGGTLKKHNLHTGVRNTKAGTLRII